MAENWSGSSPISKFGLGETSGIMFTLRTGVASYQVEDEEERIHSLLNLPIAEEMKSAGECDLLETCKHYEMLMFGIYLQCGYRRRPMYS